MQREIDALLSAFAAEQQKEARLIRDLLATLSRGTQARQRMVESLALAVAEAMSIPVDGAHSHTPFATEQVSEAIEQLRASGNGFARH